MTAAHGTRTRYQYGCTCIPCRKAQRTGCADARQARLALTAANGGVAPTGSHGTTSTYTNWGCRCLPCTEANRQATIRRRERRPGS